MNQIQPPWSRDAAETVAFGSHQPTRTSGLAITSLVLSVVVCCPLTTLAGVVTGVIAWFATRRNASLKGGWLALAAIVIGLSATIGQYAVLRFSYDHVFLPFLTGPQAALAAGTSGDIASFQESFRPATTNGRTSEEHARAFCEALTRRYGAFESAQLDQDSAASRPQSSDQQFVADYGLTFVNGKIAATCTIEIWDSRGQLSLQLLELVIHDSTIGDLRYPPSAPPEPKEGTNGRE